MEERNFVMKFKERTINGVSAEINGKSIFLPFSKLTSFEKFKLYVLEKLNFLCYVGEPQEKNFADIINEAFSEISYSGFLDYKEDILEVLREGESTCLFDVLNKGDSLVLKDRILFTFDFLKKKLREKKGISLSEAQLSRILIFDFGATKRRYSLKSGNKVFSKVIWEIDLTRITF